MNSQVDWKNLFEEEIHRARIAREDRNEGKARVCARRAAGIVAEEYLTSQGISLQNPSAYQRLRYIHEMPGISNRARQATENLLTRVTPEFTLPIPIDLIEEAYSLAQELLQLDQE